ncbi:MAG: EAL domain-containing protein [Ruminococcus sp.]|nr:EAL domain-containing protein [Ruminococcus sp.]
MPDKGFFNIAMLSASLLICLTSLLFTLIQQRTDKPQNKLYISMLLVVMFNSISQMVVEMSEPFKLSSDSAYLAIRVSDLSYFLLHTALCPMFLYYVSCVCGFSSKMDRVRLFKYFSMFMITEVLVILNPFFHFVYTYEGSGRVFTRSWGETLIYVAAALYLMLSMFRLLSSWNALTAKRRTALIYFLMLVITGVLVQLMFIKIKTELFSEALALMGVMIAVESEDDRVDPDTGFYNRKTLAVDLNSYMFNKRRLSLLCLKVTNGDVIRKTVSSDNTDLLLRQVAEYLKTLVHRYHIYNTDPYTFVLTLMDPSPERSKSVAQRIIERFEQPWHCNDAQLYMSVAVISAVFPDRIKDPDDALFMADSPLPANLDKKILMDEDLDYLLRRAAVESAVTRGLENGNFEVYYQPTYYLRDQKLHGAEALIRLHDNVIGNVYPDEFIPIAEKEGLIEQIDDFVLTDVCKFIKSGIPSENGMECINVNLSVLECMQPGFVDRINSIAQSFGIDKGLINFEITESIDAGDYQRLSEIVDDLKREGFKFSMDDYGTGYSNMQSIFSLDFDVIKIDKSILWSAEKSELGRIILENSVNMIQQMNREILVEGVETKAQINMLLKLPVDYIQGFYFSKPIPKSEFIALLDASSKDN